MAARPRMPGVRVETAEVREERVRPVAAGNVAHQQIDHRTPAGEPGRVASAEHPRGAQEIAIVEMVVVQLDVAAETGRVADQRPPVRLIGEDALAGLLRAPIDGRGEEVLQRGLQAAFALRHGGRVAQLLRQPQQRGPFAQLLTKPVGIPAELRRAGEVLREEPAQFRVIGVRRHRQFREERRQRIAFRPALRPRLHLHRSAYAAKGEQGGLRGGAPLVRVAREERTRRPCLLDRERRRPGRLHAAGRRVEGGGDIEPGDVVVCAGAEGGKGRGAVVGQDCRAESIRALAERRGEHGRPLAGPARVRGRVEAVGAPGDLDDEFAALVADDLRGRLEAHHGGTAVISAVDEGQAVSERDGEPRRLFAEARGHGGVGPIGDARFAELGDRGVADRQVEGVGAHDGVLVRRDRRARVAQREPVLRRFGGERVGEEGLRER